MTRLEMLKWMYENASNRNNAKYHIIVKIVIGEDNYNELDKMGFLGKEYVLADEYVWLSNLGIQWCKEIFK